MKEKFGSEGCGEGKGEDGCGGEEGGGGSGRRGGEGGGGGRSIRELQKSCSVRRLLLCVAVLWVSGSILGWPHPNSESDKKIRARHFLPLYDPYKWIPKGILILTTRRPLPRLKFFGFFAPHVGLQTSTVYCS